jgi:predicted HD phosphohydrolase
MEDDVLRGATVTYNRKITYPPPPPKLAAIAAPKINKSTKPLSRAEERALNDKASEEMIVAALLHDIGDELAPLNHAEYAATILKPYISKKTHWIIEKHGEFQMYYYAHHLGKDKNLRNKYKEHEYYKDTLFFCENWDQVSFDPNYKSLTLKDFEPMVKRIFSRKPYKNL